MPLGLVATIYAKQLQFRRKVLQDLRTTPYWYILFIAWYHGNPEHNDRRPYLLVDDFHVILFPILRLGWPATRDHVQHLIDWHFLERRSAKDGVRSNKFAVKITEDAYNVIETAFNSAAPLFFQAGHTLQMLSEKYAVTENQTVVPILRTASGSRSNQNISETSSNDHPGESA